MSPPLEAFPVGGLPERSESSEDEPIQPSKPKPGAAEAEGDQRPLKTLEPERDDGNVEYKLKLTDDTESRVQRLATQMRYRCDEGGSECIYRLGVEDDGTMTGLTEEEYESTIRCIKTAANMNSYSIHNLTQTTLPNGQRAGFE